MAKNTRMLARRTHRRSGFTLIEVMLVVVIIGILAGVAVVKFGGKTDQARVSRAQQDIANIGTALRMFELDMGEYPSSLAGLQQNPGGTKNWKGPYMEKLSKDPWQNDYQYQYPGSHNKDTYDLFSLGKDGTQSGDDVTSWSTE